MIISLPGWAPFGNHFLALRGASSHPRRLCVGSSGAEHPEVVHGVNLTPPSPNTKKLDLAYISTPNRQNGISKNPIVITQVFGETLEDSSQYFTDHLPGR